MMERREKSPRVRVRKARFPWPSTLAALFMVAYLLLRSDPGLMSFYQLPPAWFHDDIAFGLGGLFALMLLLDLRRFHRRFGEQKADLKALGKQLNDLWQRNRALQLKAHTYSGHADKLKLFISDKLLEYIEYDEKFLHFKGIAAEVRHNGVISFDKVQTALQRAAESAREQARPEAGKAEDKEQTTERADDPSREYLDALDAMRYLWDLLDLSTADNLALHIGNLLCECEEHYCQRLLNPDMAMPLPFEPTYSPRIAAWRALGLVHPEPLPHPEKGEDGEVPDYRIHNEQWHVHLSPAGELLGNENHLVLLLDNLLKNAQFFSRKRAGKAGIPPIALSLSQQRGLACFRVYNRGPHIDEDDQSRLFQLGYSTRRSREHHGRGLGLYFVNEIVKGYEGRIRIRNLHNLETRYQLVMTLENDDVLHRTVEISLDEQGRPRCEPPEEADDDNNAQPTASHGWTLPVALRHVEIHPEHSAAVHRLDGFEPKGRQVRTDPGHPDRPHWRIVYQPRRRNPKLEFEPLDIHGVEFEVELPTAQSRLDSGEDGPSEELDAEMERLGERFSEPLK